MIARSRRLLLIPAVGLVLLGAPAFVLDSAPPPAPTTDQVTLPVSEPAGPGFQAETDTPANLVGVKWTGDPAAEFQVEVQTENDEWTPVGVVGGEDTAPDDGSPDAASSAGATGGQNVTEGVWVGDAKDVRVTVVAGTINSASVAAVSADGAGAPSGSAGALGMSFPTGPDRYGYAIALVLTGIVLGAVASGWSPWRSRRQCALIVVVVLVTVAGCSPNPFTTSKPTITMRSQWGADLAWNPDEECAPGPETVDWMSAIVLHHTVNTNEYEPADSTKMIRAIWQYHVKTLGYCDIAYNFIIDKYGKIFEGRMGGIDKSVVAAHTGGFNRGTSGVAFLGTHTTTATKEQLTTAEWQAAISLLAWKLSVHKMDPSTGFYAYSNGGGSRFPAGELVFFPNKIVAHRDLWPTACPGDAVYNRLGELRGVVQEWVGWA